MSVFKRFSGRSTHAQPVETKDGGWKAQRDRTGKNLYRLHSSIKAFSLLVLGADIVTTAMTGISPMTHSAEAAYLVLYVGSAFNQAVSRTNTEEETNSTAAQHRAEYIFEKTAHYLFQPF